MFDAALSNLLVSLLAATCVAGTTTRPATIVLGADQAERRGVLLATTRPAHTGSAYATGFDDAEDRLRWAFAAPAAGVYQVELRYAAEHLKRIELVVNGVAFGQFLQPTGDAFATHAAGKVELVAGENVIELRRGWGFYDVDRLELIPTAVPDPVAPVATLSDPNASAETWALHKALVDDAGRFTRSGVFGEADGKLVQNRAGVVPAILAEDLMDYSPSRRPFYPNFESFTEAMITRAKEKKQIVTLSWHWTAPRGLLNRMIEVDGRPVDASWHQGYNTNATTFDLAAAIDDPAGEDYRLLLRDLDVIAAELKKFSDAGLPVLWRPLHEADGRWFWWGARGPDAFRRLWSLTRDRLVRHHNLHNLIWVYTGTADFAWYPPDDQFDVVGVDFYPTDSRDTLSSTYDAIHARYGRTKLIALTEFGGVPDLAAMARVGVRWSYFVSWSGDEGPAKLPADELQRRYATPTIRNAP